MKEQIKVLLALAALLSICTAESTTTNPHSYSLQSDLKDFQNLFPIDKIKELFNKYLSNADFQTGLVYLQSPEWIQLVATVETNPSVQKFFDYMSKSGIDIKAFVDEIQNTIKNTTPNNSTTALSTEDFFEEFGKLIPMEKLLSLFVDKLINSPPFKEFWAKIKSDEMKQLANKITSLDEVKKIIAKFSEMGIKLQEYLDFIYNFLGWK